MACTVFTGHGFFVGRAVRVRPVTLIRLTDCRTLRHPVASFVCLSALSADIVRGHPRRRIR
jgi:hypothetical protein